MKTILCTISKYWPSVGGSELHTRKLMTLLCQSYQVSVASFRSSETPQGATSRHGPDPEVVRDDAIATHYLDVPHSLKRWVRFLERDAADNAAYRVVLALLFFIFSVRQLYPLVKSHDLVHTVYNGITPMAEASFWLAKWLGKPFVFTPLLSFSDNRPIREIGNRLHFLLKRASHLFVLSHVEKRYLMGLGIPDHRISIMPIGPLLSPSADKQRFFDLYQIKPRPCMLFLGRVVDEKGWRILLEALPVVNQQVPDATLVVMGPGAADVALKAPDHPSNLIFIESHDQQLKTDVLGACDVLCLPSQNEGLGGVVIEAWSMGKPVVTSDISVLKELIADGEEGLTVPRTPEAFASALIALLTAPDYARELGEKGMKKASQNYTWESATSAVSRVYQELINARV